MRINKYVFGVLAVGLATAGFLFTNAFKTEKRQYFPTDNGMFHQGGIKGAMQWLSVIRDPVSGELNPQDVYYAQQMTEKYMQQGQRALGLNWQEVGPDNIGGRTRAILFDKNNPNIVYAGSASGGLWRSTTGGSSWTKLDDFPNAISICCMTQGNDGAIYVGTGEYFASTGGFANGCTGFLGYGIFKSTDGINFSVLPNAKPTATNNPNLDWVFVNELACDPTTGWIYAATNKGLKRSKNGGDTWETVSINAVATDVTIGTDGTIITAIGGKGYISSSGDNGSFTTFSTGGNTLPSGGVSRIEFAISPQDNNYVYASLAKSDGKLLGIYRSTDKCVTWELIGPGGSTNFAVFGENGQGVYDNVIKVFPNNKNKIIVGGIDMWQWVQGGSWVQKTLWALNPTHKYYVHADHHAYTFHPTNPDILYVGSDGGVSRSLDGGETFATLNKTYSTIQCYTVACGNNGEVMMGTQDNGTLCVDGTGNFPKNGRKISGGDGGWAAFSHINTKAYFSTIYNGGLYRSADKGATVNDFRSKVLKAAMSATADSASFITPIVYWESVNDNLSPDNVQWIADTNYTAGTTITLRSKLNNYPFKYQLPSAVNKNDTLIIKDVVQSRYILGGYNQVWLTKEALNFTTNYPKWFKIAKISGMTQCMAMSQDGNTLFLGTTSGALYRLTNIAACKDSLNCDIRAGNSCVVVDKLNNFSYGNRAITSIAVNPKNSNQIIVTMGNYGNTTYVYYSDDAMSASPTFTSKQGTGLPAMPVYTCMFELNNPKYVLLGTEFGVYATNNFFAPTVTWAPENTGLGQIPVFMIRQQTMNLPYTSVQYTQGGQVYTATFPGTTNHGVIYIGTHGKGVYKTTFFQGIEKPEVVINQAKPALQVFPNPVTDNAVIKCNLPASSVVTLNIYDLQGKLVLNKSFGNKSKGNHDLTLDCSALTNGSYIVQLQSSMQSVSARMIVVK